MKQCYECTALWSPGICKGKSLLREARDVYALEIQRTGVDAYHTSQGVTHAFDTSPILHVLLRRKHLSSMYVP